jgi:hypothetical protein
MPEVFRDNFWGQKCSAIGKRLGTTALGDTTFSKIRGSNNQESKICMALKIILQKDHF